MNKVFKRAILLTLVSAMSASVFGCGKKSSSTTSSNDIPQVVTMGESETMMKYNLEVSEVNVNTPDNTEAGTDAVQSTQNAGGNNSNGGNNAGGNNAGGGNGANGGNNAGNGNNAGGNNSNGGNNANGGNSSDNGSSSGSTKTMQAYWLDMSEEKDFVFDGQWLIIQFKVKDDAPDGNYNVDIAKLDIANWDAKTLTPTQINGCVTVGNAQQPTKPQIKSGEFTVDGDYVTAKAGDTVNVAFNISNNPGFVGFIFQFSFNSDVLEYQDIAVGEAAEPYIQLGSTKK